MNNGDVKHADVRHYRKLVDGGGVALVRPEGIWIWRYRGHYNDVDMPEGSFDSAEHFASYIGVSIDQKWLEDQRPVPNRREAVMATRRKLGL